MITDDIFLSHLSCKRKARLKATCLSGQRSAFETVQLDFDRAYRQKALTELLGAKGEVVFDPPSLQAALLEQPRFIVNATAESDGVRTHFHALERTGEVSRRTTPAYAPVLFVSTEKVSRQDKLLLAFHAMALSAVQGGLVSKGKIIHGSGFKALRVNVETLLDEVRRLLEDVRAIEAKSGLPRVTLKSHCNVCEFRNACRREAEETDDLSLLRGLSEKEVEKHRRHGISTVHQLSHTYRPGRRGKRRTGKARKHDQALQALAIREKKVYVLDTPTIPHEGVAVYLDIEGLPDRGFNYLIGLLAVRDGVCTQHSFWADDPAQERTIWAECLRVLEGLGDYTLYHYGRYESRFLERMKRAAGSEGEAAVVGRIQERSCNVLAALYSHIYFPTWSNGLKDVASFLGARWSDADDSGVQSMAWRLAWERSPQEAIKERLLTYNREDCEALRRVTEFVHSICGDESGRADQARPPVASVQDLHPPSSFHFGKTQFFCPELAHINKCAYSNYQREKVYLRTSRAVRKSLQRKQRATRKRLKVNEIVECGGPQVCPRCGSSEVRTTGTRYACMRVFDLKFTRYGVKRWVPRYHSLRYGCLACKKTFYAATYRDAIHRVGNNLASWVVYQHVALRLSHEDLTLSLNEVFGFQFTYSVLKRVKPWLAGRHQATCERLKGSLRRGTLIHADETKVLVKSRPGYVWAFTNLEEVVYMFTPTREGTILEEILSGFEGVLVSDFYSAYDSPRCKQQKCLIHLIRDVNDDLFHHPFDEELKQLAQRLVGVLKPIIDTIDRYGLKQYHLHKHKEAVARYFRYLLEQPFQSEVARKNQKRLLKYQDKLFVFLDHDGIPWNNNNAENAIKRFALRRKLIGSSFTEQGLKDYLVFLSIYQTCRLKNLSFLGFLRSGMFDLDAFADGRAR